MSKKEPFRPPEKKEVLKNLFFSMVPLFFFLLIDSYFGEEYLLYTILLTIVAGGGAFLFEWIIRKRFDWINLVSTFLIVLTGMLSLHFQSKFFLLIKPAVTEGFLALLMIGSHFFGKPLLLAMNQEFLKTELPRELEILFARLNLSLGLSMFPTLAITIFAAWKTANNEMGNLGYAGLKYGLQYGGMFLVMFWEIFRLRRWGLPIKEPTGFSKRPSSISPTIVSPNNPELKKEIK
ncbi:MAG: septation protein IspZ [Planctomycetota bacterium]